MPPSSYKKARQQRLLEILQQIQQHRKQSQSLCTWENLARPEQRIPPGSWRIWLILAGRGFGKTRTGAETIRHWVQKDNYKRICLMGHSMQEVRNVMVQGHSGIMRISPPQDGLRYYPSRGCLIWPNGAMATLHSAMNYEQLRGPQFDAVWIDELCKFPYGQQAWDQIMLSLRLGPCPRVIITTTPRPSLLLNSLLGRDDVVVTRGSTLDNAQNLAPHYIENLKKTYHASTLWQQEIEGTILTHDTTSLWQETWFRYAALPKDLKRIVVALDPAVSSHENSDETGIIVAGIDHEGCGYVLEDASGIYTPTEWIHKAVELYHAYEADSIIAEVNNGGDITQHLLHTLHPGTPYMAVRATRGKTVRAQPIAALYQERRIFHAKPFATLQHQLLFPQAYTSPDRMDALVWAFTSLFCNKDFSPFAHAV